MEPQETKKWPDPLAVVEQRWLLPEDFIARTREWKTEDSAKPLLRINSDASYAIFPIGQNFLLLSRADNVLKTLLTTETITELCFLPFLSGTNIVGTFHIFQRNIWSFFSPIFIHPEPNSQIP